MDDDTLTPHDVAEEVADAPAVVIEAPDTTAADTAHAIHDAVEESEEARWRGEVLQTLSRMETRQETLHERMEHLTSLSPSTTQPEREETEHSTPSSESAEEETATEILEPPPAVAADRAERARRKRRLSRRMR
jgi:hypothetical protein